MSNHDLIKALERIEHQLQRLIRDEREDRQELREIRATLDLVLDLLMIPQTYARTTGIIVKSA